MTRSRQYGYNFFFLVFLDVINGRLFGLMMQAVSHVYSILEQDKENEVFPGPDDPGLPTNHRTRLSEYLQSFFSEVKFHPKVPEVSGIGDDQRKDAYPWDQQYNISQVSIYDSAHDFEESMIRPGHAVRYRSRHLRPSRGAKSSAGQQRPRLRPRRPSTTNRWRRSGRSAGRRCSDRSW